MMNEARKRLYRYLVRHYSGYSVNRQKEKLKEIRNRLIGLQVWDDDILQEIIDTLIKDDESYLPNILATLDLLDLEERT